MPPAAEAPTERYRYPPVISQVMLHVVTGVATAAALWLFSTVQKNREDLVRVQATQVHQVDALEEIHSELKEMRLEWSEDRVARINAGVRK